MHQQRGRTRGGEPTQQVLLLVSAFTLAAATWLAVMENLLRHAGYGVRMVEASLVAVQSIATLVLIMTRGHERLGRVLLPGAGLLILFGATALVGVVSNSHFEGYVLVIGTALVAQGVLTLFALRKHPRAPALHGIVG